MQSFKEHIESVINIRFCDNIEDINNEYLKRATKRGERGRKIAV